MTQVLYSPVFQESTECSRIAENGRLQTIESADSDRRRSVALPARGDQQPRRFNLTMGFAKRKLKATE